MIITSVLLPLIASIFIYFSKDSKSRNILTMAVLLTEMVLVVLVVREGSPGFSCFNIYKNLYIGFFCDEVSGFFALLFSVIWALVALFAFWYIPHSGNENIFFAVYTGTLGALMGLSFSVNLITFYMFFEIMTVLSLFMVIHERSKEAYVGGYTYLGYSVFGAGLGLMGLMFMNIFTEGNLDFVPGGTLSPEIILGREDTVRIVIFVMVIGFAGKAGMFPLHSWLPVAHPIAPAPASAVLSGLITKAGVLGVIRVCYYMAGAEFLTDTWVQKTLLIISLVTVFMGSMIAYKTSLFKARLAYSSISQVSYALFGIFLFSKEGLHAAFLQILFHAISKNILFACVGGIIVVTGKVYADEMAGLYKIMPFTFVLYLLASLNLIGIPPFGGFFSKWELAVSSLKADIGFISYLGLAVLLVSAVLTAGYLLSPLIDAFFKEEKNGK